MLIRDHADGLLPQPLAEEMLPLGRGSTLPSSEQLRLVFDGLVWQVAPLAGAQDLIPSKMPCISPTGIANPPPFPPHI